MTELNRLVVDMANTNFSPFGHGPLTASMGDAGGLALSSLAPGSGSPKSATERVLKVLQYSTPTSSVVAMRCFWTHWYVKPCMAHRSPRTSGGFAGVVPSAVLGRRGAS